MMLVSKYVGNHSRNYYIRPSSLENEKKKTPPFYVSNFFAEGLLAIFGCMNEKKISFLDPTIFLLIIV